jgi:hypothetical protein
MPTTEYNSAVVMNGGGNSKGGRSAYFKMVYAPVFSSRLISTKGFIRITGNPVKIRNN